MWRIDMGLGRIDTSLSSLQKGRPKISCQDAAERLMMVVKDSIMSESKRALSVYANLRKSGRHIIMGSD